MSVELCQLYLHSTCVLSGGESCGVIRLLEGLRFVSSGGFKALRTYKASRGNDPNSFYDLLV